MSAAPPSSRTPGTAGSRSTVHGWIYGLADGLLRDLGLGVTDARTLGSGYAAALAALPGG